MILTRKFALIFDRLDEPYSRALFIGVGATGDEAHPWARGVTIAFRWLPLVRWRYLSRAWQGYPPAETRLASDWTGRERELIGWEWPFRVTPWTASQVIAAELMLACATPPAAYPLAEPDPTPAEWRAYATPDPEHIRHYYFGDGS